MMTYEGYKGGFHLFKRLGMTYRFSESDLKLIVKTAMKACVTTDKTEQQVVIQKLPRVGSKVSYVAYLGNAIIGEGTGKVIDINPKEEYFSVKDKATNFVEDIRYYKCSDNRDEFKILEY